MIRGEYLLQLHLEGGPRPAVSGSLTFFNNILHHFLDTDPDEQVDAKQQECQPHEDKISCPQNVANLNKMLVMQGRKREFNEI